MHDHDGQAFRDQPAQKGLAQVSAFLSGYGPASSSFDVVAVAEALRDAGTMVLDGVSGVLGSDSDYQADIADWYGAGVKKRPARGTAWRDPAAVMCRLAGWCPGARAG